MAYRTDFLIMMFFTIFSQCFSILVLGIIYSNVSAIGGWLFGEVLLLHAFLLFSEGSINFFFQGTWKITQMINQAELDRYILRPLPIGFQILTSRIDLDGLNKMMIGIALFLYGASRCNIHWSIAKFFVLLLSLILSCFIRTCMIWIASCTSFWLEGTKNHLNFFISKLADVSKYPLNIYPSFLRNILIYFVPYAFISYYPISYILDKNKNNIGVFISPFIFLIIFLLAKIQLKLGLIRYESSGN